MALEDIRPLSGDIFSSLRNLNRQTNTVADPNRIIRNNKAIVWSIVGLPSTFKVRDFMMKINPSNLNENYQKIINRKRTLGGFIEEHWGDQMDSISASGITSSFIGSKGLTNKGRRDTEGFKNLEQLISIYRNNGSIYDQKTGALVAQGSIVMNYDSIIRYGYFESFSISEDPAKPYNLNYEFTFKVTYEQSPGRKMSFGKTVPASSVSSTNPSPARPIDRTLDNATLDIVGDNV